GILGEAVASGAAASAPAVAKAPEIAAGVGTGLLHGMEVSIWRFVISVTAMEGRDEGIWAVLPRRQSRRAVLREMDAAGSARPRPGRDALLRAAARRAADVANPPVTPFETARGGGHHRAPGNPKPKALDLSSDPGRTRVRSSGRGTGC